MAVIREKQVLERVLQKYRELSELWDPSHELYGNKVARKEGYQCLLELYRMRDPDINLLQFKKKLENLRTTYRRERVKVVKCQKNGEDYVPSLWYYHLFTFLDNVKTGFTSTSSERKSSFDQDEESLQRDEVLEAVDNLKTECRTESPPPKKRKQSSIIFLTEDVLADHHIEEVHTEEEPFTIDDQSNPNNMEQPSTESFGRTIGLQLNELKSLQRFISEKLISDVIFYGRLGKLRPESKISIDVDEY